VTDRDGRADWSLPAAALVTLVLVDLLRVWLPSVIFVVGDAGETPAVIMGAFAIGCLGLGAAASLLVGRVPARRLWLASTVLLVVGRVGVQASDGGVLQATTSSLGLVGGAAALVVLAAVAPSGHAARVGVLAGLAGAVALHAALGTLDLAWRDGAGTWLALGLLLAALVLAAVRLADAAGSEEDLTGAGPAWPWLVVAPALVLVGIITGVPARGAIATGWGPGAVGATLVVGHGLAVAVAVAGRQLPSGLTGAAGAAMTMAGTAIALRPTGPPALAAQVALAIGLGAVVAATASTGDGSPPRRRAGTAGAGLLLFGVALFVYYGAYDMVLPLPNRSVLLTLAAVAAVLGLAAGYLVPRPRAAASGALRSAGHVVVATLALAGLVWLAAPPAVALSPAPAERGQPIRFALYNLQMGYDVAGRFAIEDQAAVLAAGQPDVVVLNEVDRGWLLTGGHDTLQLLSRELGLPYVFVPAADEVWGNALLSRYPVTELAIQRLPRGTAPMARSHFVAVLQVADERDLAVVGTHLSHLDVQGDTRLPQARGVAGAVARMRDRGLPTVVLGDLNAEPGSPELASFDGLVSTAVPDGTPTWPSWDPAEHIDHVLVSDDLRVTDVAVPRTLASDHLPVFVTLRVGER
jgi:endonuclease/exonuclease/phosphatase family metal-dependent hydrolase